MISATGIQVLKSKITRAAYSNDVVFGIKHIGVNVEIEECHCPEVDVDALQRSSEVPSGRLVRVIEQIPAYRDQLIIDQWMIFVCFMNHL